MKQNTFLYVLRLALTLLIITSIMAAALAVVNRMTHSRIRENTDEKRGKAVAAVMTEGDYILFDTNNVRHQLQTDLPEGIVGAYRGINGPLVEGDTYPSNFTGETAVEVVVPGFDGEITMMVGIDADGKVLGISIISHTETAGLGAVAAADNAKGQAFRDQFIGMSGSLAVTKDGGEVDAITGATITSRAVTRGVNQALEFYEYLREQGIW